MNVVGVYFQHGSGHGGGGLRRSTAKLHVRQHTVRQLTGILMALETLGGKKGKGRRKRGETQVKNNREHSIHFVFKVNCAAP